MARPPLALALVALVSPAALADPSVVEPAPAGEPAPTVPTETTAADVANAPDPGDESGRTDDIPSDDTAARQVGRGLLFFPKILTEVALAPLRGTIWAYDRYHLDERWYQLFFNDARTIGLYPTGSLESGFGINGLTVGARFVDRDTFGGREHLALEAAVGVDYRFKQLYALNYRTRHFEVDAGYEVRPRDPFYGIGNGEMVVTPAAMINPLTTDTAVQTRYGQHRARGRITGELRLVSDLYLRPAAEILDRSFGDPASGSTPTTDVYAMNGLVGWEQGVTAGYGEIELRWDSRRAVSLYERGHYSAGTLAGLFGGYETPVSSGAGSPFFRYGGDIQHFVRIGMGPRVLMARLHGEAITGSIDEVPFTELPALGGPMYLRGFDVDRFRDRIAAFGTVQYAWDLATMLTATAFVDVGRVWRDYSSLTVQDLRTGFGGSLVLDSDGSFVSELSLASSLDGGLFVSLSFNPVYDIDERVRRR